MDERGVRALVRSVCEIAGSRTILDDARVELASAGVIAAIKNHDSYMIFDWLLEIMQFQGVSDAAARAFVEEHGLLTAKQIAKDLSRNSSCPKLKSYYHFEDCGYRKGTQSCNRPEHFKQCPVPRHDFRNGTLNQLAFSLFLFFRDVAQGDFVRWLDQQLRRGRQLGNAITRSALLNPLTEALANVYGAGPKIASLAAATLLSGGDAKRVEWIKAGANTIVVDSLVHAWLHRTGILKATNAEHLYGAGCYGPNGCAALLYRLARMVDARKFNSDYPKYFPRFVQYAIWTFCSADGLNICNGLKIDDSKRCQRRDCDLYYLCGRQRLYPLTRKDSLSATR